MDELNTIAGIVRAEFPSWKSVEQVPLSRNELIGLALPVEVGLSSSFALYYDRAGERCDPYTCTVQEQVYRIDDELGIGVFFQKTGGEFLALGLYDYDYDNGHEALFFVRTV